MLGFVKPGLPSVSLPPFSTQVENKTYSFVDMATTLGSAIIIVPILSILQNYAIAKVYSKLLDFSNTPVKTPDCSRRRKIHRFYPGNVGIGNLQHHIVLCQFDAGFGCVVQGRSESRQRSQNHFWRSVHLRCGYSSLEFLNALVLLHSKGLIGCRHHCGGSLYD